MIYLDNAATSFYKPPTVAQAVLDAMRTCASPGRGGYRAAMAAAEQVYGCREIASELFDCSPEQVVFTANCTEGLNMAIRTLVQPGDRVVISGFEHNAVLRLLHALKAEIRVAGRKLFNSKDTLDSFENELKKKPAAAIFTHVSNVFGYILPAKEMSQLCHRYKVPFVIDAAQSAGVIPISLRDTGADFIAMPGHKALLGPQGTGILLCGSVPAPLKYGGTGSESRMHEMPEWLPERGEAGTLNVPGICGLQAGLRYLRNAGVEMIGNRERKLAKYCAERLRAEGYRVFSGESQSGVVSFLPSGDCEELAEHLAKRNIAVRAGLHCAPLAHESAGTLESGTVRVSFGYGSRKAHVDRLMEHLLFLNGNMKKF